MNFYLCLLCGNVIDFIDGVPQRVICCGKNMKLLTANSEENVALEKHVPFCTISDDKVVVQVGETIHPMDPDHYIMFIAIVKENKITRVDLKPGMEPMVTFPYEKGSTVYAYCNVHGLWKKDI